jgi:oligosaccharide repeat unit polymerase
MTLNTAAHYSHPQTQVSYPPAASLAGTAVFLTALWMAYLQGAEGQTPSDMAGRAAVATLVGLAGNVFLDAQKGLRNLFRTDFMCLVGLYGLTLLEFLFPQSDFDSLLTTAQTLPALGVILLGMAGIAVGRHLVTPRPMRSSWLNFGAVSSQLLFKAFLVAAFLGYLHMLLSVNFNPVALIDGMLRPRFSEPWARGAIGGISSLVSELSLMLNAIPPLAGVLWNRRRQFSRVQLVLVLAILALTFFQGFAGGTRNVLVGYIATFLMGYLLTLPKNTVRNTLIPIGVAVVVTGYASYHMLEFRTIGLRSYLTDQVYQSDTVSSTLAVDYNLWSIGLLVDAFPQKHEFIGSEVLTWALVKPIPRVFWPGKPLGLSVSIEEIVGAQGWTVAATYLGEAYMMAGTTGVIGVSLGFGMLCAWWNRLAIQRQSDYAMLVFALGFFVLAVSMRSMFWLTTTALPIVALIGIRKFVLR